jgi:hypothetical protein
MLALELKFNWNIQVNTREFIPLFFYCEPLCWLIKNMISHWNCELIHPHVRRSLLCAVGLSLCIYFYAIQTLTRQQQQLAVIMATSCNPISSCSLVNQRCVAFESIASVRSDLKPWDMRHSIEVERKRESSPAVRREQSFMVFPQTIL